jgi:hypothetical protein
MAACPRGLIDRELAYRGEVGLRQCQLDVALADRGHAVPGLADQPRCSGKGHLLAQHQHQRLEQERETRQLPRPRRFDLPHGAVGQPHPRHAHLQEALVLEEVEMPIALGHCVVNRMLASHIGHREATARGKVHTDRQCASLRIEIRPSDIPRRTDPQRGFKQFLGHLHHRNHDKDPECTHSDFNRG